MVCRTRAEILKRGGSLEGSGAFPRRARTLRAPSSGLNQAEQLKTEFLPDFSSLGTSGFTAEFRMAQAAGKVVQAETVGTSSSGGGSCRSSAAAVTHAMFWFGAWNAVK